MIVIFHNKEFKRNDFFFPELERTKTNLMVVKGQAEGTNREYDRLMKEHEKLQVCIPKNH